MKLFLDDYRKPSDVTWGEGDGKTYSYKGWYTVNSAAKFVNLIDELTQENMPHIVSFDHDLLESHYIPGRNWDIEVYEDDVFKGVDNWTGYHCAEYFIEHLLKNDLSPPIMYCHSLNPQGARNITRIWEKFLVIAFEKYSYENRK